MTVLATDDFNRTDAANLGANWTVPTGCTAIPVVSNQCSAGTWGPPIEFYNGVSWPDDQYAQLVITSVSTSTDSGMGPAVRVTSGGDAYFAQATTSEIRLYKRVSGGYTQLGSDAAAATANDVLYIEAQGTSILVKKNGSTIIGPVTDSSIASGNAGIWTTDIANAGDDWEGGDFEVGGSTPSLKFQINKLRPRAFAPGIAR